jgi:hypothetical protein
MTQRDAPRAAALAALRADLLKGDFAGLEAHVAALTALGEDLASGRHRPAAPEALRAEAERARDILAAAACGVRAALRRLCEAGAPASVYGADGRRVPLAAPASGRGSQA